LLALTALVALLVAAAALLLSHSGHPTPTAASVLVATARPGVAPARLLALEGAIVGATVAGDPTTGRLPDVAAFHRAGIAGMQISNGVLTVQLVPEATDAQRSKVRAVLSGSALIASVQEQQQTP
jgi:hypothetical protein